jgi:hypothetical protein
VELAAEEPPHSIREHADGVVSLAVAVASLIFLRSSMSSMAMDILSSFIRLALKMISRRTLRFPSLVSSSISDL